MGNIVAALSMSLDGFIAGTGDDVQRLFEWYFIGSTHYEMPSGRRVLSVPPSSAELVRERFESPGAIVQGRKTFDLTDGWGGTHPADVPVFVVSHSVPRGWVEEGSPFTFVTEGVEDAVERAKKTAGDKPVSVGAASVVQQCLEAGLIDEIQIDLIPVLLGDGIRLFDSLENAPIELERTQVITSPGVTHLRFRIVHDAENAELSV